MYALLHQLSAWLTWQMKWAMIPSTNTWMRSTSGHLSGIDLEGERVYPLNAATDMSNLAGNSFGQGMNVTPLQMLSAISAVANDGVMMTPRVVRSVISNGRQYELPIEEINRPISAETAHTVSELLANSLEGEAKVVRSRLSPGW